ncbi:serine--tRNA ligase [Asticcacaulis benevestitus]|uniref:Serine--tRNA ligase n=1 Tax=Asticcacaulis benevestitus DSM 16100 = ATCC BAA-896 TaxID=1121022 RepID=V4PJ28_9CAUL|nr:serine--tRNA ligase [Asticcacaulis benevestitus]ESQ93967.1 seryl-tRNA synthetase [Asticcacaulis benevestitus DSM 16100 = ATCC BAA-896]
MHDIKAIRENPQSYVQGWSRRGRETAQSDVDALLSLDADLRAAKTAFETNQAQLKKLSGEIGKAKGQKDEARAAELMTEVEGLKGAISTAQETERLKTEDLKDLLSSLPNIPFEDVPEGADEHGNVEVRKHGAPNILSFPAKDHADLGEALKGPIGPLMDFEAAAKMSGSRFVVLKGQLARLERAVGQFMLDVQTSEHGYTEINPPVLVREQALFGTGQLPKFEEDLFKTGEQPVSSEESWISFGQRLKSILASKGKIDSFVDVDSYIREAQSSLEAPPAKNQPYYLIPTAEVTLTNLVREAITAEEELPLRLTALTNCFRAEAGSAGRDTKGMIRQHQFQKVELVSITTPEQSEAEHDRMTTCAETILKKLDLSFRTMLLCTGDMGFGAKKTYDLEVWLPSQNTYREISSCSNCGDFQARRMDARTRKAGEKGTRFVHTLNGSGLAVGRTLVAIMENYQDEGGRIAIPSVLQPYMGGLTHIG